MLFLSFPSLIWAVQWLRGWHQQRKTKFKGTENWVIFPEWPSACFILSHDIAVIKLWHEDSENGKETEKRDGTGISPRLTGFHIGEAYGSLQSSAPVPARLYLPPSRPVLCQSPEPIPLGDTGPLLKFTPSFCLSLVCPYYRQSSAFPCWVLGERGTAPALGSLKSGGDENRGLQWAGNSYNHSEHKELRGATR